MERFNQWGMRLAELAKARPRLTALILGLIAACGYPPLGLWPLTLVALVALIALLRGADSRRDAAWIGYWFGWSHLTLANNWIAKAFTFQTDMPAFTGWLAVPLLCFYLAVYPALAAAAAHSVAKGARPFIYGLLFAAFWIITEWLRSWVFTGYPWPPLGLALLGDWDAQGFAAFLPWLGTYALSGLAVLIAAAFLAVVHARKWIVFVLALVVTVVIMHFPRIEVTPPLDGTRYTLVQPMIPQEERDAANKFEEHFARLAKHTIDESNPERIIFWPEAAVPDYLRDGYPQRYYNQMTVAADPEFARQRISALVGSNGLLMLGVTELKIGERKGRDTAVGAYNAVTTMDHEGNMGPLYSKAHLVPYGEYLALRWLLEPLGATRLVAGTIDFIPGPGPQTYDHGVHGKVGVQICYEIIFSGQVVEEGNRPDYIFNPSNDGWFGAWGPPQFLAQSRLRAIEEGLPVIRSTTTGISAVIDAHGSVVEHIPSGVDASVSGFMPGAHPPTLFAQWGNALPLAWAVLLLFTGLGLMRLDMRRRAV